VTGLVDPSLIAKGAFSSGARRAGTPAVLGLRELEQLVEIGGG